MERTVFLDIETIPAQNPDIVKKIREGITPPANIKTDESKAKWLEENLDEATKDAVSKTSFNPALGHICTIGWAVDDEEPVSAHARTVEEERDVLAAFFASVKGHHRTTFVGHNLGAFDLRFILCRAVVLGVTLPHCLPRDPKPWDKTIFDTMTAWAGARDRISMDNLCQALGLTGKEGFDGSMVADAWANGEHERIAEYCADDVRKTREVYRKFAAVGWAA
ncbi:ribonuclease H-like domain-containing protein [Salipiger thiooxidans]|uniref:ribonuclease H-like domain-containing protein n=1 Tax=Salipiger thiooxidans TaxID=282683 RepID=UPI001A8DD978|nr:ribonuclease H-like domain-containing protein [Salipiger thiooxidans]MBN8189511.1 ribonuclease H-like domain-containing protein [Salipiger thiooxidans]